MYKADQRTVKFSTVLVSSSCFDLNFALRGFTNLAFVLVVHNKPEYDDVQCYGVLLILYTSPYHIYKTILMAK